MATPEAPSFANDETASRDALQAYLEEAGSEGLRAATSPERAEVVSDLWIAGISGTPGLAARTVAFGQSNRSIPIFGGRVLVDIDAVDKSLLSINGKAAPPPDADGMSGLSATNALLKLVERSHEQGTTKIARLRRTHVAVMRGKPKKFYAVPAQAENYLYFLVISVTCYSPI